ncbi:MAG: glycosyltransferase [Rhodospirillaceae bacterium]|jgi:hopene-associated glycosyltransferase HpnB|nr:glycosyltransferase [Rhodospirillaceae bacterium]MBT5665357.1 glycosyltransferase [Rhodospirillaceae bacterium]MBT5812366.1 glycosyltransferase [Rhodospirillaceae bacterium]
MSTHAVWLTLAALPLVAWLYLLFFHGGVWGGFWRTEKTPDSISPASHSSAPIATETWPEIVVVIPARDEVDVIGKAVASLLNQDYPLAPTIVMVDDGSRDGTATTALEAARAAANHAPDRLDIVTGAPRPPGWSGKVWAMRQGAARAAALRPDAKYILFTDADIEHHPSNLRELTARAEANQLDLTSLMVRLATGHLWERLLMPPFVFFFRKLYPFPWVNDPTKSTAAAAGGCMLVRRATLDASGGLDAIRGALIDDCALADLLKHASPAKGRLWLGLSERTRSIRSYDGLRGVWNMVARGAFTQLRYSPTLLAGTVLGMALLYLAPPLGLIATPIHGSPGIATISAAAWTLMTIAAAPTYKIYGQRWCHALWLPVAAAFFTAMTVDSAWRHWRGRGGGWKGRTYSL